MKLARVEFMMKKMEEIGRAMGGAQVWRNALSPGAPGAHHEGGTRMGNDPNVSVVNKYGQSWDIPNLFVIGCIDLPVDERLQPDAHHPGARLHERRRHRQQVQEEPGPAAVAPSFFSLPEFGEGRGGDFLFPRPDRLVGSKNPTLPSPKTVRKRGGKVASL